MRVLPIAAVVDGDPVAIDLARPAQSARVGFDCEAGQQLTFGLEIPVGMFIGIAAFGPEDRLLVLDTIEQTDAVRHEHDFREPVTSSGRCWMLLDSTRRTTNVVELQLTS